jgi:hypothetical protein
VGALKKAGGDATAAATARETNLQILLSAALRTNDTLRAYVRGDGDGSGGGGGSRSSWRLVAKACTAAATAAAARDDDAAAYASLLRTALRTVAAAVVNDDDDDACGSGGNMSDIALESLGDTSKTLRLLLGRCNALTVVDHYLQPLLSLPNTMSARMRLTLYRLRAGADASTGVSATRHVVMLILI